MIFLTFAVFVSYVVTQVKCLHPEYFELVNYITVATPNCTVILYNMKTFDIEELRAKANAPLMVATEPSERLQEILSIQRSHCVTLFTHDLSPESGDKIEWLLSRTRHKKVFVLDATMDDANLQLQRHFLDSVILAQMLSSGDLILTRFVPNNANATSTMMWLGKRNRFLTFVNNLDFTLHNNTAKTTLQGKNDVTVSAVVPSIPFTTLLPNKRFGGVEFEIMNMIGSKFGFQYKVRREKVWEAKVAGTNNWTGVVGSVINGNSEFGLTVTYINGYGSSGYPAVLSPPIYTNDYNYLVPKPKLLRPYNNFVRPFQLTVWLAFFGSLIVYSVVAILVIHHERDNTLTPGRIVTDLFGSMWQQNIRSTLGRQNSGIYCFLFGFWFIGMLFKGTAYNCDLRAFIVKREYETPIETDEDLVRRNVDTYFALGSGTLEWYQNAPSNSKREIFARAIERKTTYQFREGISPTDERMIKEGGVRLAIKSRNAFVLATFEKHYGYQPLQATKYVSYNFPMGIAMPFYQPWTDDVNKVILRIIDGGIVNILIDKNMPPAKHDPVVRKSRENNEQLEKYRIEHVMGPLLILACGLIVAMAAVLFEVVFYRVIKWNHLETWIDQDLEMKQWRTSEMSD